MERHNGKVLNRMVGEIKVECDGGGPIMKNCRTVVIQTVLKWAFGLAYVVKETFLTMNNVDNIRGITGCSKEGGRMEIFKKG